MRRRCPSDLRAQLYKLMNNENHRNNLYRQMAPYRDLSEKDLLTTIGSCSSKVPAPEKQRHLEQLAALSQDRVCQTKRIKKRIAHISDIIQNDPPYFFPRPYSYYNYYYRPFGGFLSALILLGLLDAIF